MGSVTRVARAFDAACDQRPRKHIPTSYSAASVTRDKVSSVERPCMKTSPDSSRDSRTMTAALMAFVFAMINSALLTMPLAGQEADAPAAANVTTSGEAVRVMSFNIRYGTAKDGDNHWDHRREFLLETIRGFNPDLLGTQETLKFQRDWLAEQLDGYAVLGVGRNDGVDDGEMMALYYRRGRFELLDSGHFWLSETPDVVGSKSWDSSLPRMVTWVRLQDRRQSDGRPLLFLNTHFDHMGRTAREESSRLLRRKAATLGAESSIVVTGDFNAAADSEPYVALFSDSEGAASPLVDSFRASVPAPAAKRP